MNLEAVLKRVRPNILALEPYSTARDECRGSRPEVFLDANESPYDNGLNRYPDPRQRALKEKVAELKGMSPEQLFLGNGSDEAIDLLFRVFCRPGLDNAVSIAPSYGMYSVAAATNDIAFREVPLRPDFSLDAEAVLAAADANTQLLFLCYPNNPSGNSFPAEEIVSLLKRFPGVVVLDEAYIDFSERPSLIPLTREYANLVVLQTLSKAWGMAGLRVGLAVADPGVAALLDKVKYPYNINIPAQKMALAKLDPAVREAHVREILGERVRVAKALQESPTVLRVYPSDANFLLVKVTDPDGLYARLIERKIIVRNRSRVPGCGGCLRITIGTPSENDRLLRALGIEVPGPADGVELLGDRHVRIRRKTRETDILLELNLDGPVGGTIRTGLPFFDHMLEQIPHHGGVGLRVEAKGDLQVDEHHTVEDVGIVLGEAID